MGEEEKKSSPPIRDYNHLEKNQKQIDVPVSNAQPNKMHRR